MRNRIFQGATAVEDQWQLVEEDSTTSAEVHLLYHYADWIENRATYLAQPGAKGVLLSNTDDVASLMPDLERLALICIDFPEAVDGRGYSQARLLRDRLGYSGELRAVGEVLVDQLFLMRRCGFDAYALPDKNVECISKYLDPFTVKYQ